MFAVQKELLKLKKSLPTVFDVLVTERDHYLAKKLSQLLCQLSASPDDVTVLAVVGKGHQERVQEIVVGGGGLECKELVDADYWGAKRRKRNEKLYRYSEDDLSFMCDQCIVCDMPAKIIV